MARIDRGFAVACAGIFIASCASAPPPTPAAPKQAVQAGVFYSPQFVAANFYRGFGPQAIETAYGAESVKMLDEALAQIFEKVTRVDNLSREELRAKGVELVVLPSVEYLELPIGFAGHDPDKYAIVYRTTLRTKSAVPLGSWLVSGSVSPWSFFKPTDRLLIDGYIADAGKNYVARFNRDMIRAALASGEAQPAPSAAFAKVAALPVPFPLVDEALAATLRERGIIAIRVTASSFADAGLVVRRSDMRLRLPDGQILESMPPSLVFEAFQRAGIGVAVTGGCYPAVTPAGAAIGGVMNAARVGAARQQGFYQLVPPLLFGDSQLTKDREQSGVVVFQVPNPAALHGAVFTAWAVDPLGGKAAEIVVPLPTAD